MSAVVGRISRHLLEQFEYRAAEDEKEDRGRNEAPHNDPIARNLFASHKLEITHKATVAVHIDDSCKQFCLNKWSNIVN